MGCRYSFAVIDVEGGPGGAGLHRTLGALENEALASIDVDPAAVRRKSLGHGSLLALPGSIPPRAVTVRFVGALFEAIRDYDAGCAPGESVRAGLALNSGEIFGRDVWSSGPASTAIELVNSPVMKRVLTAAVGSPLAVIVSDEWYSRAPANGSQPVRVAAVGYSGPAWIGVPGSSWPPGLLAQDEWAPPASAPTAVSAAASAAGGREFHGSAKNVIMAENVNGGVHIGDVIHGEPGDAR